MAVRRGRLPGDGDRLVIVLVAVIGSVAKAVTGMGLPVIAIPIAALFVDIDTAVVVIAFPNVLANLAFRERPACTGRTSRCRRVTGTAPLPARSCSSVSRRPRWSSP